MMETAYGVGVQNRYALFLDDADASDPDALFTNAAAANPTAEPESKSSSKSPANKTASAAVPSKPSSNVAKSTVPSKAALAENKPNVPNQKDAGRPNRARVANSNQQARSFNRENQENRNNRSPRTFNNSYEPTNDDLHDGKDTRTERTASNRGQRGPRRGNGPPLRYRNMNNRHSGSDKSSVKPTEKREGGGAHNWGKSVDEFSATAEEEEVVNGDKPAEDTEKTGTEQDGGDAQENVEPKNDEPQFKTLDEYKREREEKRMHTQFNTRKPGEGEDKSKWKKTYVLKKKPEPEEEEVEYEEIEVEEDSNKRRHRQVLDIELNFRPSEDGRDFGRRGGRGGRGGGGGPGGPRRNDNERRPRNFGDGEQQQQQHQPRPSGGRGRGRGGGHRFQPAPKFDDLNDFPSLSS